MILLQCWPLLLLHCVSSFSFRSMGSICPNGYEEVTYRGVTVCIPGYLLDELKPALRAKNQKDFQSTKPPTATSLISSGSSGRGKRGPDDMEDNEGEPSAESDYDNKIVLLRRTYGPKEKYFLNRNKDEAYFDDLNELSFDNYPTETPENISKALSENKRKKFKTARRFEEAGDELSRLGSFSFGHLGKRSRNPNEDLLSNLGGFSFSYGRKRSMNGVDATDNDAENDQEKPMNKKRFKWVCDKRRAKEKDSISNKRMFLVEDNKLGARYGFGRLGKRHVLEPEPIEKEKSVQQSYVKEAPIIRAMHYMYKYGNSGWGRKKRASVEYSGWNLDESADQVENPIRMEKTDSVHGLNHWERRKRAMLPDLSRNWSAQRVYMRCKEFPKVRKQAYARQSIQVGK